MKIISINGSRRKKGNTDFLIQSILKPLQQSATHVESIVLGDYTIGACTGCECCSSSWQCVIKDDFQSLIKMMDEADGIVLASPTYWYTVTSDMKCFIDRCYSLVQFPKNRSEWIGKYDGAGKSCVTAAVCEQKQEASMGNTLTLLTDFAKDIGLNVVDSVKALNCFEAGSIQKEKAALTDAEAAGQRFLQQLRSFI
ncbi:flavodoxin family protein [Deltaproteobacteria bacterium IMCC39524]|nr:flavodoxin family protein [Deltaproteobacteria bacterium IMCC39524]